jgi:hypothetical protein
MDYHDFSSSCWSFDQQAYKKLPEKVFKSINRGDFLEYFISGGQRVIARLARGQKNRMNHD